MNLKEAAQRLGVHYQTAYKWVRLGELTAMRVGGRYEISDAAITQFQAGRRAMLSEVEPVGQARRVTDMTRDDLLEELEAMAMDPIVTIPAVVNFAARRGAEVLGDVCFVVKVDDDGQHVAYSAIDHPRADRAAFLSSVIAATGGQPISGLGMALEALSRTEPVRVSHYPQDRLRAAIRSELHQHAAHYGIHSLLAAPIVASSRPTGFLGFTRDTPSHAYTDADEEFAVHMGRRVGWLFETAREIELAWQIRRDLAVALRAKILGQGTTGPPNSNVLDQLFQDYPAAAQLPVAILDDQCRYLTANETFLRVSGHSLTEKIGQSFEAFTHPDERADERTDFERLISGELDFLDVHARRVLANGTHLDYASHRAAVRDPDATLRCVITVARPIHTPTETSNFDPGVKH